MPLRTKIFMKVLLLAICFCLRPGEVFCEEPTRQELRKEMQALKERIRLLEKRLEDLTEAPEQAPEGVTPEKVHGHGAGGVKGLADRVRTLEEHMKKGGVGKWADRISLSGLVEVAADYQDQDHHDRGVKDTSSSDITLATVELGVDAEASKHLGAHVLFLWEEDDTEPVDLDEGYIILDGKDVLPLYLNAGKMYVPFGRFESHFISDPLTLELGETRETAVKAGYTDDLLDFSVSVFNGDVEETGRDDHVRSYVLSGRISRQFDTPWSVGLEAGGAYISSVADTNNLGDNQVASDYDGDGRKDIRDDVGGISLFLSLSFDKRIFLEAEYVGALERFEPGELAYDGGRGRKPRAWNLELAYAFKWNFEVGLKAEGSRDCGRSLADDFLPERQYGVVLNYEFFENAVFSVEYLRGIYDNDDTRDLWTTQVSLEF